MSKPQLFLGSIFALFFLNNSYSQNYKCIFASKKIDQNLVWRLKSTHQTDSKLLVSTNKSRESEIKKSVLEMEKDIRDGTTPGMEIFPAKGIDEDVLQSNENSYDKLEVTDLGKEGVYYGTLLLPVSAHDGLSKAKTWAKNDTYEIKVTDSKGKTIVLEKKKKSLGFVTLQEIELKMIKGEPLKIEYHRSGSGGPGGFSAGRIIELIWDGK